MKKIDEVVFGFSDAENYRRRENKELFSKIFLRTDALDQICEKNTFFLVGDKGAGKTAYAVYLSNSVYRENVSLHRFIRETDYLKFLSLKKSNNLTLSDYTDIWKVIIYFLIANAVYDTAGSIEFLSKYKKFKGLRSAIEEYYSHAFSPEIPAALQLVENSKLAAELIAKHLGVEPKIQGELSTEKTKTEQVFQTNLLYLEKKFEEVLSTLKISQSYLLFIDGVDIRPASVPYEEYLDCVKGLANAVWAVNNDFFPNIRDSKGRMRIILLVRPDIFNSMGLQNRNTKLRDNAVVLDWRTTYADHRSSDLFALADRMFSAQQESPLAKGVAWDHYFPFHAATVLSEQESLTSFIVCLRYSFHRPRDILTILDTLRKLYAPAGRTQVFAYSDLMSPNFRRAYGDYVLGEIKDSLSFYYNEDEFEYFLKFFEFLDGEKKFDYQRYLDAYASFFAYLAKQGVAVPDFMKSEGEFLQFLYDLNVICFFEATDDKPFIRWCFLERTSTNLSPKVRPNTEYEIHYALANVLNTGKRIRRSGAERESNAAEGNSNRASLARGQIKWFDEKKGYGFINQPDLPVDIFFHKSALPKNTRLILPRQAVQYKLEKDDSGRLIAVDISLT